MINCTLGVWAQIGDGVDDYENRVKVMVEIRRRNNWNLDCRLKVRVGG